MIHMLKVLSYERDEQCMLFDGRRRICTVVLCSDFDKAKKDLNARWISRKVILRWRWNKFKPVDLSEFIPLPF